MISELFIQTDSIQGNSKQEVLNKLAQFLSNFLKANTEDVYQSLMCRENHANTAYQASIAIPHVTMSNLTSVLICVARLQTAVGDWMCLDGSSVQILICLILPKNYHIDTPNNIEEVTQLFQLLANDKLAKSLSVCPTSGAIIRRLTKGLMT